MLEEDEKGKRYKLVRVWEYARAIAILATAVIGCKVSVADGQITVIVLCKFDLKSFFRKHGKQRAHIWQGGRATADGFGTDMRTNFGERDAPDHTGRCSNMICLMIKRELKRLEREYPPREQPILDWLHRRESLRTEASKARAATKEDDFTYAVLFYVLGYVDDFGLAIVNDLLFHVSGKPVICVTTRADGTEYRYQRRRGELYFEAAYSIAEEVGYGAPEKKRAYPTLPSGRPREEMLFLGIGLDARSMLRYIECEGEETKGFWYAQQVAETLHHAKLVNKATGVRSVDLNEYKSMVHRLLHASEVIPAGRPHLFHCLKLMTESERIKPERVMLSRKVVTELEWWLAALNASKRYAVPMASRRSFPGADESGVLTHYGDASREFDEETRVAAETSGYGAWSVINGEFCYIEGRWSDEECAAFSINILESAVQNFGAITFVAYAKAMGEEITHVHTFVDNTSAEYVNERGKTGSEGMNMLNIQRQDWLLATRISQRTSRVASVFNDVADLLSRGDIDEALRFASEAELPIQRLAVAKEVRDLSAIAPTWA